MRQDGWFGRLVQVGLGILLWAALLAGGVAVATAPAAAATTCSAGSYYDSATGGCVPAPLGTYVGAAGATSATPCPLGTFQDQIGQISCIPAPAGRYVDTTGAIAATPCPLGTFQDQIGQRSCIPAPAGRYVGTAGAIAATPCPLGTFQDQIGQISCIPAPAGRYVGTTGAIAATPCALGTFQGQTGQSACIPASAGTYVDATGATSATPCALGTFQGQTGQSACIPAPAGTYVDATGATSATFCSPGSYQDLTGQANCKPAPPGSYVGTLGAVAPTLCPAGTTASLPGQTACYKTPVQSFGSDTSTTPGGTATASAGGVTATATGAGTVSVAGYNANPGGKTGFAASGSYFDVAVLPGATFSSLAVVDCGMQGGNTVFWWNGSAWLSVSDQTYDAATGCVAMTFDAGSSPSLAQLTGTPFAAAIVPPEATIRFAPPPAGAPNLQVAAVGAATATGPSCAPLHADRGASDHRQGEDGGLGPQICTYRVAGAMGASLTLELRVQRDGRELKASVVSLTYAAGSTKRTITPANNALDFQWSADKAGHLRQLQEQVRVGKDGRSQSLEAHYDARRNTTEIRGNGRGKPATEPGLALLTLTTRGGRLLIGR